MAPVFCGRENSARRRGRGMGTRLQCFKKGVGVGMGVEQRKQREQAAAPRDLNSMNMPSLRVLAQNNNVAITHTVNGVNKRKTKSILIADLRAAGL